jgi:hypothetical protein
VQHPYRRDGSLRTPEHLEKVFLDIKADAKSRQARLSEASIPALTAENRTRWAEVRLAVQSVSWHSNATLGVQIREAYFSEGLNRRTLHAIESALLYIVISPDKFDQLDWTGRGRKQTATPTLFTRCLTSLLSQASICWQGDVRYRTSGTTRR